MRKLREKKGVTLIELLVIVVIIGIVAALAVPRFTTTINRLRFRTEARDMVSKLRLARSNAITQKQQFGVHLDNSDFSLTLFLDSHNPGAMQFENLDSVLLVDTLPYNFTYLSTDFGDMDVVYRPNGSASTTGAIYFLQYDVDVVNTGRIDVLASTGRTKLGDLNYY